MKKQWFILMIVLLTQVTLASNPMCISLFKGEPEISAQLMEATGKFKVAPQVLPNAKKSIWMRLAELLRLDKISFFRDLFGLQPQTFKLIGPSIIPETDRTALPVHPEIGRSLDALKAAFKKRIENLNPLLPAVPEHLQIELSNIFVTLRQRDLDQTDHNGTIRQPLILGRFKNSEQPVLVYVLTAIGRSFDISAIRDDQNHFVSSATLISNIGVGLPFYGVHPIDKSGRVVGLVFGSPGPVKQLIDLNQEGSLTANHLMQVTNSLNNLRRSMGNDTYYFNFVVDQRGKVIAMPSTSDAGSTLSLPAKYWLVKESVEKHGLTMSTNFNDHSLFRYDIYELFPRYFEMLCENSRDEAFQFLDWLRGDAYLFPLLVKRSFHNETLNFSATQNLSSAQTIHVWAESRGVDLLKYVNPDLPTLPTDDWDIQRYGLQNHNKVIAIKELKPGMKVLLKTDNIDELAPNQRNYFRGGVSVKTQYERPVVLADGSLGYQFILTPLRGGDGPETRLVIRDHLLSGFEPVIVP